MRWSRLAAAVSLAAALSLTISQSVFAAHAVHKEGSGEIYQTYGVNLDNGAFNSPSPIGPAENDIWFQIESSSLHYIENNGPNAFILRMASKPGYNTCAAANLIQRRYNVANNVGSWFCVLTNKGRYARFHIDSVPPDQNLDITFTTWV
jgi:hypothetical protein